MNVICCQANIVWEDKRANFSKVREMLKQREVKAGALIVLPEMFATGFSMNVEAIHESAVSETEMFLSELARDHSVTVVGGLVVKGQDGRGRNRAIVVDPTGRMLVRYDKIHPFSFGSETKHYAGGSEIVAFDWQGFRVTPFICYDLRFPEIFRIAALQGTQLFVVIANWPSPRVQHWTTLLQARAIENQAYVVGVNRTGNDPKLSYPGRSLIINPRGELLADAGAEEGVAGAEVDLGLVKAWRTEFPALLDAHKDYYQIDF